MRDLEIRGAGNMLGSQQSGHITAVGFDLYCQLLKQSVSAFKGEKVKPRVEVQVRLDFIAFDPADEIQEGEKPEVSGQKSEPTLVINISREVATYVTVPNPQSPIPNPQSSISKTPKAPAYLPLSYITDPRLRIEVYRKLAQSTEKSALQKISQELRDRFGPLPRAVDVLLQVAELKLIASEKAVTVIETREDKLLLTRLGDLLTLGDRLPRLMKTEPEARLKEIKRVLLAM